MRLSIVIGVQFSWAGGVIWVYVNDRLESDLQREKPGYDISLGTLKLSEKQLALRRCTSTS